MMDAALVEVKRLGSVKKGRVSLDEFRGLIAGLRK
jgi:hypothetical protein